MFPSLPYGVDSHLTYLYLPCASIQMRLLLQGLVQAGGRKGTWNAQGRWENSFLSRLNQFWFTSTPPTSRAAQGQEHQKRKGMVLCAISRGPSAAYHIHMYASWLRRHPERLSQCGTHCRREASGGVRGCCSNKDSGLQPILMGPVSQVPTVPWKE